MDSIAALLETRQQLDAAYRKDVEAIEYLLSRLGYKAESAGQSGTIPERESPQIKPRATRAEVRVGTIRDWVRRAFRHAGYLELTAPEIYRYAVGEGHEFKGDRNKAIQSIGAALRQLVVDGELRVSRQGAGKRPTGYTWVGEMSAQDQQQSPP